MKSWNFILPIQQKSITILTSHLPHGINVYIPLYLVKARVTIETMDV